MMLLVGITCGLLGALLGLLWAICVVGSWASAREEGEGSHHDPGPAAPSSRAPGAPGPFSTRAPYDCETDETWWNEWWRPA